MLGNLLRLELYQRFLNRHFQMPWFVLHRMLELQLWRKPRNLYKMRFQLSSDWRSHLWMLRRVKMRNMRKFLLRIFRGMWCGGHRESWMYRLQDNSWLWMYLRRWSRWCLRYEMWGRACDWFGIMWFREGTRLQIWMLGDWRRL